MKIMLSLYKEALKTIQIKLQHHIADGSWICLNSDSQSTSNSDSYLSVIAYWTDIKWITYSLLLKFAYMPLLHIIGKAYFKALISTCKRFSIHNYILSITTNSHVVNNGM